MFALLRKRRSRGGPESAPRAASAFRPAAHVIETAGEGRIFLLDTKRERFLGLDDVGVVVWEGMKEGRSLGEISARIRTEYDGAPEEVDRDVLEFVGALLDDRLVERVTP